MKVRISCLLVNQASQRTDGRTERKHPCTQPGCPLMFIRLEHAKRHSEICGKSLHSTKQVPCPVCGTLFTREDNMKCALFSVLAFFRAWS